MLPDQVEADNRSLLRAGYLSGLASLGAALLPVQEICLAARPACRPRLRFKGPPQNGVGPHLIQQIARAGGNCLYLFGPVQQQWLDGHSPIAQMQ